MIDPHVLFERYSDLQTYVGWTEEDASRVRDVAALLDPRLEGLVDDFYAEIDRHEATRRVITGGTAQVVRLKGLLVQWLRELLAGPYDAAYVQRRWRVGWRHVEIGLDQVYTNMALSRLRAGLHRALLEQPKLSPDGAAETVSSLDKLLDLDLAIIEDAYQAESLQRQQRIERLAILGQVAGGVAHEIRNPLNVIKTSVYFLVNARNASPEKRAEHLARIEKQVGLADGVVTALSNFARMPVPHRVPFGIRPLIEEILDSTRISATIEVSMEFPDGLPSALGDPEQVRIAFSNLIRNARDAMPDGGRLQIGAVAESNIVEVTVSDTGHGIPAEFLPRIMEPFFTTKARGIGLGLPISRAILEKNQGALSVESDLGHGTRFTVRLQQAPEGAS
jgi:signal transduction histidine kinase